MTFTVSNIHRLTISLVLWRPLNVLCALSLTITILVFVGLVFEDSWVRIAALDSVFRSLRGAITNTNRLRLRV